MRKFMDNFCVFAIPFLLVFFILIIGCSGKTNDPIAFKEEYISNDKEEQVDDSDNYERKKTECRQNIKNDEMNNSEDLKVVNPFHSSNIKKGKANSKPTKIVKPDALKDLDEVKPIQEGEDPALNSEKVPEDPASETSKAEKDSQNIPDVNIKSNRNKLDDRIKDVKKDQDAIIRKDLIRKKKDKMFDNQETEK